jgi:hypothetical protein
MKFQKGQGGRPKGATNVATREIKQAFHEAFFERGGVKALLKWADENPTDFYRLAARLIPVELAGTIAHTHKAAQDMTDDELARIAAGSGQRAIAQASSAQTLN